MSRPKSARFASVSGVGENGSISSTSHSVLAFFPRLSLAELVVESLSYQDFGVRFDGVSQV